jgi:hypothetical protein
MKKISSLVLMSLMIFLSIGGVGRADQHDRLVPLLSNLEGWQAQPAKGMSMISAQMKMISASRIYRQADKNLTVNIMINSGPVVDSDLQESSSDNDVAREQSRLVDGFWVKSTHTKKNGSGEVIVYLDYNQEANGVLVVDYAKMSDDEVLQIIRSMDWKKLKKVVSTLL